MPGPLVGPAVRATSKAAYGPSYTSWMNDMIAGALIACLREISKVRSAGSRSNAQRAAMLEAGAYAAVTKLAAEISAITTSGETLSPEDAYGLKHLEALYLTLSILALMVSQLRRDLADAAERFETLGAFTSSFFVYLPTVPIRLLGYLDSS